MYIYIYKSHTHTHTHFTLMPKKVLTKYNYCDVAVVVVSL